MIEFSYENLSDSVFHHATATPDAPALLQGRETLSYGRLAELVRKAAVYLTANGIKPHDRVGIALTHSIERVVLAWALMRIGATGIELQSNIKAPDIAALVVRFAMQATLVEADGPASPAKIALTIGVHWRNEIEKFDGDMRYDGNPDELTLINLSSGSTGLPKGLVCTHQHRLVRSRMTLNASDFYAHPEPGPLLLAAPANTNLVWGVLVNHLILGGPVVLMPTYRFIIDLVRDAVTWDNAIFPVPPEIARHMLECTQGSDFLFPKMRALITAGQAISSRDKQALIKHLTPHVYEFYGSGGIGMLTTISPTDAIKQPKSVGKPVSYPGVEVQIASPDGRKLPPGSIGQLRVRGPNTAMRFFNAEDNERGTERFSDGWYYPGEVASLNKAGYLILEGRMADAINIAGKVIYPTEIEEAIGEHPLVAEAAVVGRTGPLGEDIVAFIVGRPGYQHLDIVAHCRKVLSSSMRPKYIYYLENMPRTGNGKIDRAALKAAPLRRVDPI